MTARKAWLADSHYLDAIYQRVPESFRRRFIDDLVSSYLDSNPSDQSGRTHVRMVRLEVEALKLQ